MEPIHPKKTDEAANEIAKLLMKFASSGNIKETTDTLRNASSSEKRVSESKLQQCKHMHALHKHSILITMNRIHI